MNPPDSRLDFYAAWDAADEEKKDATDQDALYRAWAEADEQQEAEYYRAWNDAEAMSVAETKVKDEGGVEPAALKRGKKLVRKKRRSPGKQPRKSKANLMTLMRRTWQ